MSDRMKKRILIISGVGLAILLVCGIFVSYRCIPMFAVLSIWYVIGLKSYIKSYKETAQRTQSNRIERRHRKYTVTGFSNYPLWKEIGQVYEKACKDEESEAKYITLERKALEEAARACREGGVIAEQAGSELWEGAFGALSANDKITAIDMMRELSIIHSSINPKSSVLSIELSAYSRENPACTVLGILSLLEGLEESQQIKDTKWRITLVCEEKDIKGIREWRDFIRDLYPWSKI